MFENFWFNVEIGFYHVLDINGYDHLLFLALLATPYILKHWKRVLILVSLFTLGHTLSLVLAAYDIVNFDDELVEFLIPLTILVTAIYNLLTAKNSEEKSKVKVLMATTLFFGLIHGLGFGREFKMLSSMSDNKLEFLIEFALGIEFAQIIIVFVVLLLGYLCQTIFKVSKRDWVLVCSSIVIGLILPILI